MTSIVIGATTIRQDGHGRYRLNDLHEAAGGDAKHKPSNWLRQRHTQELVATLQAENARIRALSVVAGRNGGSFVVKEMVYWYASWVSPAFHLQVIRAYDALSVVGAGRAAHELPETMSQALRSLADALDKNERLEQKAAADAPKVEFHDAVADDNGTLTFREVAKVHGMSDRQLIGFLMSQGVLGGG